MVDLALSDEQEAIVELVRSIARDRLDPAARAAESASAVPDELWATVTGLGLTAPVPTEHGGGGIPDPVSMLLVVEGLATGDGGIATALALSGAAAVVIGAVGTPAQCSSWLPRFVADDSVRAACALYEGRGRAPSEYVTTVTPEAGAWRVRGRKLGVAFAGVAEPVVVVGNDPAAGRLRAVVLDRAAIVVAPATGQIALGAARLGSVEIDATVPEDAILGGPDAASDLLDRVVGLQRLLVAALLIGTACRAVEYAADYARERIAYGRPIASLQGVSFLLAEAATRLDAARLEVWDVATSLNEADPSVAERAVSMAVNYAGDVATTATRDAVQVLGGHGFIEDHPVERYYRTAVALSALDFDPTCIPFTVAL